MFRLVHLSSGREQCAYPRFLLKNRVAFIRTSTVSLTRRFLHRSTAPLLAPTAATLDPDRSSDGVRSAEMNTPSDGSKAASAVPSASGESVSGGEANQNIRDQIIAEILARDKEIFELKRQHELSMLRVEQHQRRILKDQEDRGMYYEQNCNVHTFDTVSVGLHSQRTTLYHTLSLERLRNFKIILSIITTFACCWYIYYRYMINPEFTYVEKPMKVLGSRVQAIREMQWDRLSDEEKMQFLQEKSRR